MERLKTLLFADELHRLKKLEARITEIRFRSGDPAHLKAQLLPLFDDLLLERLRSADQQTVSILAEHLAAIVARTSEIDPEAFKNAFQGILTSTIKEQIASNKEVMVDALYPILGGMISKYVSSAIYELMESINAKINQGLSLQHVKRKIKSKVTGVSETELLLEESSEANVSSLFVIHKESGMLISEAHQSDKWIDDPHLIASMASAIKDFINDWIQSKDQHEEVQLLSYGNSTLYIESAGSVYLIAFMDAEPDREKRAEINRFFASLVQRYLPFFQTFDGDDSRPEVQALAHDLNAYLQNQGSGGALPLPGHTHGSRLKYVMGIVLLALLIPAGFWLKHRYVEYTLETRIAKSTGASIDIALAHDTLTADGMVDTVAASQIIEKIISNNHSGRFINHITLPVEAIDRLYRDTRDKTDESMNELSRTIDTLAHQILQINVKMEEYNRTVETLLGQIRKQEEIIRDKHRQMTKMDRVLSDISRRQAAAEHILTLQERIHHQLDAALAGTPCYDSQHHALIFSTDTFFPKDQIIITDDLARKKIAQTSRKYLRALLGIPRIKRYLKEITIAGYADSDGTFEYNMRLSTQRAAHVKEIVSTLDVVQKNGLAPLLKTRGYGSGHPILINGIEDKSASRRTEIHYVLNGKKIRDAARKLLARPKH